MPAKLKGFFYTLIVYWYLKTFTIMAIDLKFIDDHENTITSSIRLVLNTIKISVTYGESETTQSIYLDKSTAIKFAKTLRTEINKIEEVTNG